MDTAQNLMKGKKNQVKQKTQRHLGVGKQEEHKHDSVPEKELGLAEDKCVHLQSTFYVQAASVPPPRTLPHVCSCGVGKRRPTHDTPYVGIPRMWAYWD